VQAAAAGGDASEQAVLDWLCLHVDPADLPRRFAGAAASRAAPASIKVVSKADEAAAAARRFVQWGLEVTVQCAASNARMLMPTVHLKSMQPVDLEIE
jgi:hypothetical protein